MGSNPCSVPYKELGKLEVGGENTNHFTSLSPASSEGCSVHWDGYLLTEQKGILLRFLRHISKCLGFLINKNEKMEQPG
jgi:hypothetical protein